MGIRKKDFLAWWAWRAKSGPAGRGERAGHEHAAHGKGDSGRRRDTDRHMLQREGWRIASSDCKRGA
jgi:hypothetical protein